MPMFQALKLCPQAVVVKPRMAVYVAESRKIRAMMEELTPDIEPLSLDEAFLDLRHSPPAWRAACRDAGAAGAADGRGTGADRALSG
jgi:nucleotidyltransferase/DNA polymerase involved in DNA repair